MNKLETEFDSFEDSPLKWNSPQHDNITVERERSVKKVPPDGGWGWVVVFGSFIGMILSGFPSIAFSILFSPILMSHEVSSTKISWIFNLNSLVWSIAILFIGPICDEFGWRKVAIFGGITNSLSVLLSAFAPNPEFLIFSYSLLGGVGGAIGYSLSVLVVSKYFEKHRGLALGITSLAGCVSRFLGPILAIYLLEHYAFMGASLIFSAILLNQCVGGALYQPIEWHMKYKEVESSAEGNVKEELLTNSSDPKGIQETLNLGVSSIHSTISGSNSSINNATPPKKALREDEGKEQASKDNQLALWSVLKSTYNSLKSLKYLRVHLIAWGYCSILLGSHNFRMWVPFVITNAGYSLEAAAWCLSLASIVNFVGRLVMSLLADRKFFNVRYGFMLGLSLTGTSIIAFSLINDIKLYIIFICIWGLGLGFTTSLNTTVIINVMGIDMLPTVFGAASLLQGFVGIALGILAGMIRDATSSYTYTLWMLGGCVIMTFTLWLFMPCFQKFDKKKYPESKMKQQKS